jgi:NAD(P)-dependent dehydrogenase (short-subunit alcohol dehydrogenase family)
MINNNLFSVAGKTALITGGATGLGYMAAQGLMQAGAKVIIASRKLESCQAAADKLNAIDSPGSVDAFQADLSNEAGTDQLIELVNKNCDELHVLMNNAGSTWGAPKGEKFPFAAWEKVMSVNVAGLFHLSQGLLPLLSSSGTKEDPARIINIGSMAAAMTSCDGAYSYAASKAAVHHMTKIMANEYASQFVTVNAIAPGPFKSRMTEFIMSDPAKNEFIANKTPLGRLGEPEDIAGVMQFLCSRAGAYVTGSIIPLSGGLEIDSGPGIYEQAIAATAPTK